jgi:ubiquinone/menaquinone biosynthesis C-methylase UbiE
LKKSETSWGGVSSWYDDHLEGNTDTYQEKVILPNLERLTSGLKSKHVLDLACGQGYFSRALGARGLTMKGVDVSAELIQIAKSRSPKEIEFFVSPADDLSSVADASVDGMLKECARVLSKKGSLFIVMNHPVLRIPKRSSWGFDEKKNIQYRRVDAYLSESKEVIDMTPGSTHKNVTVSFHRPLQYYMKQLHNAGFLVSRCEEWTSHKKSEPGTRAKAEDKARLEFPLFLMLEAVQRP